MQPYQSRFLRCGGLALAALSLLGATLGCGSARRAAGTSAAAGGSAVISIAWPDVEGRAIPAETKGFVIRVVGDQELGHLRTSVARPTESTISDVVIEGLPFRPVLFIAEAYNDDNLQAPTTQPIARGYSTVEIRKDARATIGITLTPSDAAKGSAVVLVRDVPPGATGVSLRVLQNGQVIPGGGEPPSISFAATEGFTTVPFGLVSLPVGSLLFQATAHNSAGTAVAQGSRSAAVVALTESMVTVALAVAQPGDGTDTGGGTLPTVTLGSALVNVSNIATGDALLMVDPRPGQQGATDPDPVTFRLKMSEDDPNLPINRVPILVTGLQPGPWLFVVTTHSNLTATSTNINRVGTVSAFLDGGQRLSLDAPLTSIRDESGVVMTDGDLNVLTTNITGQSMKTLMVAVFSSTERQAYKLVDHVPGVNERLVTFRLAGGSYTIVSAMYDRDSATLADELSDSTLRTMPANALSVGSTTARVASDQVTEAALQLRLQAGTAGSGSVNLAMTQVPIRVEEVQVGDTGATELRIVSGIVIRVFAVSDNQELTALQRIMLPPEVLVTGTTAADKVVRLRIDGVPVGLMRFEVTATAASNGTGSILGTGSTIANIVSSSDPAAPPTTAVTVAMLPHGDLPPGTVLPGTSNPLDPDNNPEPPTPARFAPFLNGVFRRR